MNAPAPLEQELATYQKEKGHLLHVSPGKYVLIKGQEIIGVYAASEDALAQGYNKFGNTEFLVKKITEFEEIGYFTRVLA